MAVVKPELVGAITATCRAWFAIPEDEQNRFVIAKIREPGKFFRKPGLRLSAIRSLRDNFEIQWRFESVEYVGQCVARFHLCKLRFAESRCVVGSQQEREG